MKYEKIKSIVLTVLVLISILFTWNLWTYQPNYELMKNANYIQETIINDKKDIKDIIKPNQILIHRNGLHYGTTDNGDINQLLKEVSKWSFRDYENISATLSKDEFFELVHGNGNIEIIFPDRVPFSLYKNILDLDEKKLPKFSFSRIIINIENKQKDNGTIYFVNYDEYRVVKSHVSSSRIEDVERAFYRFAMKYPRYTKHPIEQVRVLFMPENATDVKSYKYYPEYLKTDNFKDALFKDPSLVNKDFLTTGEEYTDYSTMMRVDYSNKMLYYINPAEESDYLVNSEDTLIKSIDYINEHGGWTDNYKYVSWSQSEPKVVFRLYVDGHPVYNEMGMSELVELWGKDSINQYIRPYFSLGIPLPSEMVNVTLPPGHDVLEYLRKMEGFNEMLLQELIIGYQLSRDPKEQKLIALEPAWFYQYDGAWGSITLDDLGGDYRGLE